MENDYLRLEFLPEIGGKMNKIINKETGRQFLLEPQNSDHKYRPAFYGANFQDYDTSGFDECFPTIEACEYPSQLENTGIYFPDHGELWSIPWDYQLINNELLLICNGIKFPYHFAKRINISEREILIHYHLENFSDQDFYYLWSAHPLLKVEPGDRIFIRDSIDNVFLNWASDERIGNYGDNIPWPHIVVDGTSVDFSVVRDRSHEKALKCFTGPIRTGEAAIHYSSSEESLVYKFNPEENRFLGIWLCYGGWPTDQESKHLTIALEPSSGRPDSLKEAIKRMECSTVAPKSKKEWDLKIQIITGLPEWVKSSQYRE
jgi:hypothetical protein